MFRIPKLSRALVRNPGQGAVAWWPPIGRKDRLPNNQHTRLPVRVPRKDLLGCGRPPQTSCSSRGQQEHDPESIGIAVKGSGELVQICVRERRERFLAGGHRRWPPKIHNRKEQNEHHHRDEDWYLNHCQNRIAMIPAMYVVNRIIAKTSITAAAS